MSRYNNPPYDHSITCSAHHLRQVNSNLLRNSYSLNLCLATTRMSHFLLHPWSLTFQMPSKFSCSYEFHALSLTMPPYLAHPTFKTPFSLPFSPTHWLCTTCGGVENLPTAGIRQGNLELTAFFIPLITPETQRCYTVLTPRSHFLAQNNQEQNNARAANPEKITTYCSRMTLLPLKAK